MIAVPTTDPVGALVPHSLKAPLTGLGSGPLTGRTFMVKDLFAIAGQKVGNGNPAWYAQTQPATETASAIQRLLDEGAACTGITVCDEFFYSLLGTNIHYGTPVNPRSPGHVTGGSSCGSAASVAAGLCDFALGSDTGGSIRVPASYCGLYGLRPTHGRIVMKGATPMAPSYDTVGYLTREAGLFRDVGHVLLEGERVDAPIKRLIVAQDMFARAEAGLGEALWKALDRFGEKLPKSERMDIAGQEIDAWRDAFRVIQGFEVKSTLLPFVQSHGESVAPAIRERFALAAAITPEEAEEAKAVRAEIRARLMEMVQPGTIVALPATPELPPSRDLPDDDSTAAFRQNTLAATCLAGHACLPQISIPVAQAAGCPVGLSFIGWPGGDEALLDLAVRLAPLPRDA